MGRTPPPAVAITSLFDRNSVPVPVPVRFSKTAITRTIDVANRRPFGYPQKNEEYDPHNPSPPKRHFLLVVWFVGFSKCQ